MMASQTGYGGLSERLWIEGVRADLWLRSLAKEFGNFQF